MAMTVSSVPAGWNYSAMRDGYDGPNGEFVSMLDVRTYGSLTSAIMIQKKQSPKVGDRRININTYKPEVYDGNNWVDSVNVGSIGATGSISNMGQGQLTIGKDTYSITNATQQPTNLTLTTSFGPVTLDLQKGYITIPPGIGTDDAIREFWLAFQKYFKPVDHAKYEQKIKDLENRIKEQRTSDLKEASKKVAEKIRKKYNGEKFIMVKPEDLIKFIEEQ